MENQNNKTLQNSISPKDGHLNLPIRLESINTMEGYKSPSES